MKVKTSELTDRALRYAVAVCEGFNVGTISVEEQWARFIDGASPEELEKHADGYALIKAGFRIELCKVHADGYKSALDAQAWCFDEDWSVGGPIIEREKIDIEHEPNGKAVVRASTWLNGRGFRAYGPTPLIAAMRCLVSSRLGDEVEIPEEFL